MVVELRCMRGLPAAEAAGVKMKLKIAGQEWITNPSTFEEPLQDFTYDGKIKPIDAAAQRLAEFLSTEHQLPVESMSKISGIDPYSLENMLKERPSFTTRWNQGFNILLDDVNTACVDLLLVLP